MSGTCVHFYYLSTASIVRPRDELVLRTPAATYIHPRHGLHFLLQRAAAQLSHHQ